MMPSGNNYVNSGSFYSPTAPARTPLWPVLPLSGVGMQVSPFRFPTSPIPDFPVGFPMALPATMNQPTLLVSPPPFSALMGVSDTGPHWLHSVSATASPQSQLLNPATHFGCIPLFNRASPQLRTILDEAERRAAMDQKLEPLDLSMTQSNLRETAAQYDLHKPIENGLASVETAAQMLISNEKCKPMHLHDFPVSTEVTSSSLDAVAASLSRLDEITAEGKGQLAEDQAAASTSACDPVQSDDFLITLSETYFSALPRKDSAKRKRKPTFSFETTLNSRRILHAAISRTKDSVPFSYIRDIKGHHHLREHLASRKRRHHNASLIGIHSEPFFSLELRIQPPQKFLQTRQPIKLRKISRDDLTKRVHKIAEIRSRAEEAECDFEGVTQDCPCTDLPPGLSRCLECGQADVDNETAYCRFRDFRKLSSTNHVLSPIVPIGFICHKHDLDHCSNSDAANIQEWLPLTASSPIIDHNLQEPIDGKGPQSHENPSDSNYRSIEKETAAFILSHVAEYFRQLLNKERILLTSDFWKRKNYVMLPCMPWKDSSGVRELCDVCSTTIFNLHLICRECGLAVCSDCFFDRMDLLTRDSNRATHDMFGWTYCTRKVDDEWKRKICHKPSEMILAHLIPECGYEILSTLVELDRQVKFFVSTFGSNAMQSPKIERPLMEIQIAHWRMFDDQVLVLRNCQSSDNLLLFQKHWKSSYPLIIENVHEELTPALWKPSLFAELCRDHDSYDCIVDCRTGKMKSEISVVDFWNGFTDCSRRLRDKEKRKLYLKLKDWPPGEKFASVLREHYMDFCKALPIPEYTHPESGRFNLATKLPSFYLAPDLGPKMYTAYDMIFEPDKGTTNLHLDVSDAVNILVNVTTPENISVEYLYREIFAYLEKQDLDPKDLERAKSNPQHIGALWTIFKPMDNGVIREFLHELINEKRDDVNDPIHDQKIYLHRDLRSRLGQRGVRGFTFVQMLGDAVFIPAGAAHQVQNLLCCIKVAEDFVSPEGVQRCAIITDEFRSLTKDHTNHEDKLQLPNIVTHAARESVAILRA